MPWIQLKSMQNLEMAGVMRTYHPGDWVEVGKQTARQLVMSGQALSPSNLAEANAPLKVQMGKAGVLVPEGHLKAAEAILQGVPVEEGPPELRWDRTAIWDPAAEVHPVSFVVGIELLDRWELAVPLYDYKTLAIHMGTEAEREQTKAVIRDLRAPLYDVRLMFLRRCENSARLLTAWNRDKGENRYLAFLRALYKVKPLTLALPAVWTGWNYAG